MEKADSKNFLYADDATEKIGFLVKLRLPWLLVGLFGGIVTSIVVSRFETLLAANIKLAFFVPIIVFMADAIGEQTETIFIRNVTKGKIQFWTYFIKELGTGAIIGSISGLIIGLVCLIWLGSANISIIVGFAMFATVSLAPVVALMISSLLNRFRVDPALGSGPFTTVAQNLLSLSIYFYIATLLIT